MAQNETPQPITHAEFISGVEFYVPVAHDPYFLDSFRFCEQGYILDKKGNYYCSVQYHDDDGFIFIHSIFGHLNEFKIYFNQCFKSS